MPSLGFEVGEVWGHALNLPEDSPAWPNVSHAYRHVIDHCRLMVKFEEWFKTKHLPMKEAFLERLARARSLGKPVIFTLDYHNTWHLKDPNNPNNYHKYTWFPAGPIRDSVAEVLDTVLPLANVIAFQVGNEPYAKTSLGTEDYASYVYEYVRGATDAGFSKKILAQQTFDDRGHVADGWEWHVGLNENDPGALIVPWTHGCVEGKHRHPRVLHGITTTEGLRGALNSNAWAPRRTPKGWRYLVWHDEMSPLGKEVHINSNLGGQMVTEALSFFHQKRVPMTFLTMGGYKEDWGADGNQGWGMNTDLINKYGKLSVGCKALYDFKGVPYPDDGGGPVDPPGDAGMGKLNSAQSQLEKAERRWGSKRGIKHANRGIKFTEEAIGQSEGD